jgi:CTP-dependent riboflavin kinase
MITTKKLIKISKSLGIVIDKPMIDKLKLKHGDMVEINIKKVKNNGI